MLLNFKYIQTKINIRMRLRRHFENEKICSNKS